MLKELEANVKYIHGEIQEKLLPENIKKGISLLGVDGTLEVGAGDVKLFETTEAMYSDEAPVENGLAVVYESHIENITSDSQFQIITFPHTVVLPESINEDTYYMASFRSVNEELYVSCYCDVSMNSAMISCDTESMNIRIEYTSTDGITYTRIDSEAKTVDFGTELFCDYSGDWSDAIGYFMLQDKSEFNGLYQYGTYINKDKACSYSFSDLSWDKSTETLTTTNGKMVNFKIEDAVNKIIEYYETNFSEFRSGTYYDNPYYEYMLYIHDGCLVFPFATQNEATPYKFLHILQMLVDNTTWNVLGANITTNSDCTYDLHEIKVDMTTGELLYELLDDNYVHQEHTVVERFNDYEFFGTVNRHKAMNDSYEPVTGMLYYDPDVPTWYTSNCVYTQQPGVEDWMYMLATTQLTVSNSGDLLPGKIAYGKNGVVVGDDSVYDNIPEIYAQSKIIKLQAGNDLYYDLPTNTRLYHHASVYPESDKGLVYLKTSNDINAKYAALNPSKIECDNFTLNTTKPIMKCGDDIYDTVPVHVTNVMYKLDPIRKLNKDTNEFEFYSDCYCGGTSTNGLFYCNSKDGTKDPNSFTMNFIKIDTGEDISLGDFPTLPTETTWSSPYTITNTLGKYILYGASDNDSVNQFAMLYVLNTETMETCQLIKYVNTTGTSINRPPNLYAILDDNGVLYAGITPSKSTLSSLYKYNETTNSVSVVFENVDKGLYADTNAISLFAAWDKGDHLLLARVDNSSSATRKIMKTGGYTSFVIDTNKNYISNVFTDKHNNRYCKINKGYNSEDNVVGMALLTDLTEHTDVGRIYPTYTVLTGYYSTVTNEGGSSNLISTSTPDYEILENNKVYSRARANIGEIDIMYLDETDITDYEYIACNISKTNSTNIQLLTHDIFSTVDNEVSEEEV